jgi:hypothetical protein
MSQNWEKNRHRNDHIYNKNTGNVGVGVKDPISKLHVEPELLISSALLHG